MDLMPIIPFEPIVSDSFPKGTDWIHQIKWDGVRILTYYDGSKCRLFNRKLNERTSQYPELLDVTKYCMANSVILDGEIIALGSDGKPSFHEVMRRDSIRRKERVGLAKKEVAITYLIFDVIFYDGQWVNEWPLRERNELLIRIITPNENVQLVSSHSEGNALYKVVQDADLEGIVCKDLNGTYAIDGKDDRWVKVKNYGDVVAVIGGFTLNGGIVNAILLGLYDLEGKLLYIGHTGTGRLTSGDWRKLTEILKQTVIKDRPFHDTHARHKDAYWVQPLFTVKIKYTEWRWKEGRSMRQPSIQAFMDLPPGECILPHTEGRKVISVDENNRLLD
jgi:bifunctional non-homologous end joining protein LigD